MMKFTSKCCCLHAVNVCCMDDVLTACAYHQLEAEQADVRCKLQIEMRHGPSNTGWR